MKLNEKAREMKRGGGEGAQSGDAGVRGVERASDGVDSSVVESSRLARDAIDRKLNNDDSIFIREMMEDEGGGADARESEGGNGG